MEDRTTPSAFTVINTSDDGPGSLRWAILEANANPGPDVIDFHIEGDGVQTISVGSATGEVLPTITDAVTIDGYSQPGASANTLAVGNDAVLLIEIDGTSAGPESTGLHITAGDSTVQGLMIDNFHYEAPVYSEGFGILLETNGGNVIRGNWLGLHGTGSVVYQSNDQAAVAISSGSANNLIGGTTPAARNVLAGNGAGVYVTGTGGAGNVIRGNYVGTDPSGTGAFYGNQSPAAGVPRGNFDGLVIFAPGNIIGGSGPGEGNVISGNTRFGLYGSGTIQGNLLGADATGTDVLSNGSAAIFSPTDSLIGGTAPGEGNVITAYGSLGIWIDLGGGNTVQSNFIGTRSDGTTALGAPSEGVTIQSSANNTVAGNVIANHSYANVYLFGPESTGNVVQGNMIGTNADGSAALGQNGTGVLIVSGAHDNLIGGTTAAARNVISGNLTGVAITGTGTTANTVSGNYVGVNEAGTASVPNIDGVYIGESAHDNTVGGTAAGAGNVLSGNQRSGALLLGAGTGNLIQGNLIGTDPTGLGYMGNGSFGVIINSRSSGNTVGGTAPGAGNVISYNGGPGITVNDAGGETNDIVIQGNKIGTDITGTVAAGNGTGGVLVIGSLITQGVHDILIGGTAPDAGNLISNNGEGGVIILGPGATGITVRGNSIHDNAGLGIDLGIDSINGVTPNDFGDADTGANNLQNFPDLTAAVAQPGGTRVVGSLSGPASTTFTVDFYASPGPDPSGNGEGQRWLGYVTVTTSASGTAPFVVLLSAAVAPGQVITATATDAAGSTSEFSHFARVVGGRAMDSSPLAGVTNAPPVVIPPAEVITPVNTSVTFVAPKLLGVKSTGSVATAITVSDVNVGTSEKAATNTVFDIELSAMFGSIRTKTTASGSSATFAGTLSAINSWLATLVYDPPADFTGMDYLRIQVTDSGDLKNPDDTALNVTELVIHVGTFNHPPVVSLPEALDTPVNMPVYFGKLTEKTATSSSQITVTDPDVSTSKSNSQFQMRLWADHGTLTSGKLTGDSLGLTGTLADVNNALSQLTYRPNTGFIGADILHILVLDLGDSKFPATSSTAELTIHVGPYNRPPLVVLPVAPETPADTAISFGKSQVKLATTAPQLSVTDPDVSAEKDATVFSLTLTVTNGTLALGEQTGASITITGTLAQINKALTTLVYRPAKGFVGVDVLEFHLTDFGDPDDASDDLFVDQYLGLFVG